LGGLFVLLSTAVCAELIGMTPRSGGVYALVRHAYGPYPGFVIGWVDWLTFVADLALKAVVIVEFTAMLIPGADSHKTVLAILITSVFAAVQLRGISLGALVQQVATSMIGLMIVVLSLVLFFVDSPLSADRVPSAEYRGAGEWSLVIATIVFTYDGWMYASYFSGELKGGAGAAARSCIKGVVMVIALYLLLNGALVSSVGMENLAGSELALARALELALSPAAGSIVVVGAILILLSHQNLNYMGGPRVLHALAVDGLASSKAQKIGKGGNPVTAILITWVVSVGLILVGGFEFLLLLSVFLFIPLYMALIIGVVILRRREPDAERPYRAWGYPISTVICLAGWTIITLYQAYAERDTALYTVALVAVSLPVYYYFKRARSNGVG
jgi:APA family basic amino acid/polyamine antiporter